MIGNLAPTCNSKRLMERVNGSYIQDTWVFSPQGSLLHFFYIKNFTKEFCQDRQKLSISEYMYKVYYNFESSCFHVMHIKTLS